MIVIKVMKVHIYLILAFNANHKPDNNIIYINLIFKILSTITLEKEMTTHSNVLAWRILGMGEPGGLPSMGLHRVGHDWAIKHAATAKSLQSCPTLQPQRQEPTRLPSPWDSPGKNIGVGCHFLLQCMKVEREKWSRSVASDPQGPPWTAAFQASPSMGFSRQECRSGVPLPSPAIKHGTAHIYFKKETKT